ncbi:capsule biosynthesis GfcC family protein [Vibrio ulleungensis]|uniref:Capsule biosynthesis GfcC family protein n=1 Tax=Vibrio ulleungensis TaxID=2807619 RepID=A0ABS2HJJ3_9VIBR|nr:capsule biosynthesis GfcC family protein [Vibrio ulleungensis]MBM7037685.1 capsule biosynthesis GfcC family protein [Vibrio ulleungensis]
MNIIKKLAHVSMAFLGALMPLLLSASEAPAPTLSITLASEGQQLQFDKPSRLSAVVAAVAPYTTAPSIHSYPMYSRLFSSAKQSQAEQLKQQVLTELHNRLEEDESYQLLINEVHDWTVGYRELLSLDQDVFRIDASLDPMLAGDFDLELIEPPSTIEILGLVNTPQLLTWQPHWTASDYIKQSVRHDKGHRSYVWIVYPDGHITRSGYAYWNNEAASIVPGSVLFVGYNSDKQATIDLEQNIAKLIASRHFY